MNVALIGNPNCGKTSVFNKLTGSNQKVGNWPGVTIERKEGKILKTDISIVDLPGIYSLEPYTSEEIISRDYLLENRPDLVVNVVDSTALERSLFLTTQLFDLGINVVLALNMTDLLRVRGLSLDEKKLSKQMKYAADEKYDFAIILGGDELESGTVVVKDLSKGENETVTRDELIDKIKMK